MGIRGMGHSDFAARIDRLDTLSRSLTKELGLWQNAEGGEAARAAVVFRSAADPRDSAEECGILLACFSFSAELAGTSTIYCIYTRLGGSGEDGQNQEKQGQRLSMIPGPVCIPNLSWPVRRRTAP